MNQTPKSAVAMGINSTSSVQNATGNYSTVGWEISAPSVIAGCMISLIIIVVVIGNLLVIIAVAKDKQLKSLQNRFILSLAIADLLLGLLIMPLGTYLEVLQHWGLGSGLCDAWLAADVFLCTASTLSLVAVSLDRYMSVTKALEYPQLRNIQRVNIAITGVWVTSALVSLPPLAGWKSDSKSQINSAPQCNLSNEIGYMVYSLTFSFYIPMVIILIAYCGICSVARRRSQHIRLGMIKSQRKSIPVNNNDQVVAEVTTESSKDSCRNQAEDTALIENTQTECTTYTTTSSQQSDGNQSTEDSHPSNGSKSTCTSIEHSSNGDNIISNEQTAIPSEKIVPKKRINFSFRTIRSRNKDKLVNANGFPPSNKYKMARGRERRATITIAIIVAAFIICWLPFSLLYLIDRIFLLGIRDHPAFRVMFWLGYCNSALNPIVYTIFNHEFRHAFTRLLCPRRNHFNK